MRISMLRFAVGGLALLSTVSTSQCAKPEQAAEAATLATELKPLVSVKELMENIIDPQADFIFDAVAVDIGEHGIVETKPTSEDDWLKVQRATVLLAESTNLLKMPRRVAPEGDKNELSGPGQPELAPEQIQAKLDRDRRLWNSHVDQLRDEFIFSCRMSRAAIPSHAMAQNRRPWRATSARQRVARDARTALPGTLQSNQRQHP